MKKGNPVGKKNLVTLGYQNPQQSINIVEKEYRTGELSDQFLLEGLLKHDNAALETLYRLYYPISRQLVVNNSGTEDDAKDIFQETLMVLYEKVQDPAFGLQCRLGTFLYSVSRHLWLKKLRREAKNISLAEEITEAVPVEEETAHFEEKDRQFRNMEQAMSTLGEPCKTLLEDYYLHRQSMQDIAAKFGYTNTDNAKNQKYKCLMRLKKLFFSKYKKG